MNTDQENLLELMVHPGWKVFVQHMEDRKKAFENQILAFKKDNKTDDYLKGQREYAQFIVGYKDLIENADREQEDGPISRQETL